MSSRRTVAMVVNDDAGYLTPRAGPESIASRLAPTEGWGQEEPRVNAFLTDLSFIPDIRCTHPGLSKVRASV